MVYSGPSEIIEEIRAWVDERFRSLEDAIEYQKIEEIIDQLERLQIPVSEEIKSKKTALESSLDASNEGGEPTHLSGEGIFILSKRYKPSIAGHTKSKNGYREKSASQETASRIS